MYRNNIDYAKRGFTLVENAEFEYRSDRIEPDRWLTAIAVNPSTKEVVKLCWYYTRTAEKIFSRTGDGADLVSNWNKCSEIESHGVLGEDCTWYFAECAEKLLKEERA